MDLSELWIGDHVKIRSTLEIGTYEGKLGNDIAIIKVHHKKKEVIASDLESYTLPKPKRTLEFLEFLELKEQTKKNISSELDLHIKKLNASLKEAKPERILDYQINACKQYLKDAITLRRHTVKIIHGKGTGQLKAEVLHILGDYSEVHHNIPANDGGAVDVWFQY